MSTYFPPRDIHTTVYTYRSLPLTTAGFLTSLSGVQFYSWRTFTTERQSYFMLAQAVPPGLFHLLKFQGTDARMNFRPGVCS